MFVFFLCYSLTHDENPREIFPYGAPLLPTGIFGKLTPPPSPLENPIPSVVVVWHTIELYRLT